jgi:hypothetical protein
MKKSIIHQAESDDSGKESGLTLNLENTRGSIRSLSLAAFPSCLYTTLVARESGVASFFRLIVLYISSHVSE